MIDLQVMRMVIDFFVPESTLSRWSRTIVKCLIKKSFTENL